MYSLANVSIAVIIIKLYSICYIEYTIFYVYIYIFYNFCLSFNMPYNI